MTGSLITHAEARNFFAYVNAPDSLVWANKQSASRVKVGDVAGVISGSERARYRRVEFRGRAYSVHRLVWFWHTGEFPLELIDHINCDTLDNRIENLRPATASQNQANRRKHIVTKRPFKGVMWRADRGYWVARLSHDGKLYSIGGFSTPEQARDAYFVKAQEIFGEFARAA